MSINITTPANLFTKNATSGPWVYSFFQNMKAFEQAKFFGSGSENVFNLEVKLNEPWQGEYADAPTLAFTDLASVRDYANGGSDATVLTGTARNDRGVWCRAKFGPFNLGEDVQNISVFKKEQMLSYFAEEVGKQSKAYIQKFVLAAAKAAIAGMTTAKHTYSVWNDSTPVTLSTGVMSQGRAKLGDTASDKLGNGSGIWVYHSQAEGDLASSQITANLFGIVEGVVRSASPATLGAPAMSYDATATYVAPVGTAATHGTAYTLGLGKGLGRVIVNEPKFYEVDQRLLSESVSNILRADLDFYVELPGFSYDATNGGANPSLTTISNSAYWVPTYADHREVPGIVIAHNVTGL